MFPHLYTRCSTISTFGMCFHKQSGTHMCILIKTPKWQENAIVFPALITIVLGKHACVKNVFFFFCVCVCVCFLKTEIRSCFSRPSSPESLFLPETLNISRSKAQETTCSEKSGRMRKDAEGCGSL